MHFTASFISINALWTLSIFRSSSLRGRTVYADGPMHWMLWIYSENDYWHEIYYFLGPLHHCLVPPHFFGNSCFTRVCTGWKWERNLKSSTSKIFSVNQPTRLDESSTSMFIFSQHRTPLLALSGEQQQVMSKLFLSNVQENASLFNALYMVFLFQVS